MPQKNPMSALGRRLKRHPGNLFEDCKRKSGLFTPGEPISPQPSRFWKWIANMEQSLAWECKEGLTEGLMNSGTALSVVSKDHEQVKVWKNNQQNYCNHILLWVWYLKKHLSVFVGLFFCLFFYFFGRMGWRFTFATVILWIGQNVVYIMQIFLRNSNERYDISRTALVTDYVLKPQALNVLEPLLL